MVLSGPGVCYMSASNTSVCVCMSACFAKGGGGG